jgi:hypothetical protein
MLRLKMKKMTKEEMGRKAERKKYFEVKHVVLQDVHIMQLLFTLVLQKLGNAIMSQSSSLYWQPFIWARICPEH